MGSFTRNLLCRQVGSNVNLDYNILHLLSIYIGVVAINLLVKWAAGHLVGGPMDAVGKAIINVAP